jgi:hypothetical protein
MGVEMPRSVVACGGILARQDGREVPDTLDALFDYGTFCVNMGSTFNSAATAGQGIQFLGTDGSLSLVLGKAMIEQAEYKAGGYGYSIDSWPKAMQEEFMNQDNHREELQGAALKPAPENITFDDKPDATVLHLANFFEAVRTLKSSYETAEVGHHAASVNCKHDGGKRSCSLASSQRLSNWATTPHSPIIRDRAPAGFWVFTCGPLDANLAYRKAQCVGSFPLLRKKRLILGSVKSFVFRGNFRCSSATDEDVSYAPNPGRSTKCSSAPMSAIMRRNAFWISSPEARRPIGRLFFFQPHVDALHAVGNEKKTAFQNLCRLYPISAISDSLRTTWLLRERT